MSPGVTDASAEIDHLGGRAGQRADVSVCPHGHDATARDGHCLGNGVAGVHGDDLAVHEHELGRRCLRCGH